MMYSLLIFVFRVIPKDVFFSILCENPCQIMFSGIQQRYLSPFLTRGKDYVLSKTSGKHVSVFTLKHCKIAPRYCTADVEIYTCS